MITSDFVIQAADFDGSFLKDFKPIKRRGRKKSSQKEYNYLPLVCAFDIETTTLQEYRQAFMYHWQFQLDRYVTITGRTWEEFTALIGEIIGNVGDNTLVCYVHNLSYEWQFMSDPSIYDFVTEEIFALDERTILKCRIGSAIEFRCSYRLFNQGLGFVTKDYDVKHKKLDGDEYDYNRLRFPWTPLDPQELEYCYNDVRGLVESIYALMEAGGDDLRTAPMTSTGYPRRDCKRVLYPLTTYIRQIVPSYRIYQIQRKAFRGGDTHQSRHWVGCILEDVFNKDISSDYPAQVVNRRFPMSAWYQVSPGNLSDNYILDLIGRRQKALLIVADIYDLKLKIPDWPAPYLSKDKCEGFESPANGLPDFDNGRILQAKHVRVYLTDIDLRIVLKEYDGTIIWRECYYSKYGNIPRRLIEVVNGYYTNKTQLKGVDGQEINYMEDKKKLNGIYGMMATDPVKVPLIYDNEQRCLHFKGNDPLFRDEEELLDVGKIYDDYKKKAWIPYAWGVWCTAWARYTLHEAMWEIAKDKDGIYDLVYWDTDSLKHFNRHEEAYNRLNRTMKKLSKINGGYAVDPKGTVHYMGLFEEEKPYKRFIGWGSKKYAYEYDDGKTHVTIAGVNKRKGAVELETRGGLEALTEGFIFDIAGGTESVYNDYVPPEMQDIMTPDGKVLHITKNIAILPSSYTLNPPDDYDLIFENAELWRKMLDDTHIYSYTSNRSTRS